MKKIICLCGSTKFKAEFEKANRQLTLKGYIVLAPGVFMHSDGTRLTTDQKIKLDQLHKIKIDMSDQIFVVAVGGYIGPSTRSEIDYAEKLGKRITYLELPHK